MVILCDFMASVWFSVWFVDWFGEDYETMRSESIVMKALLTVFGEVQSSSFKVQGAVFFAKGTLRNFGP